MLLSDTLLSDYKHSEIDKQRMQTERNCYIQFGFEKYFVGYDYIAAKVHDNLTGIQHAHVFY